MKLYLVRHGETVWNLESRFQGWTDKELSHKGREQAAEIGRQLSGVHFDAAYSSTLSRAFDTARIILGEDGPPVKKVLDLREHNLGGMEGLREHEIEERFPGQLQIMRDDPEDFMPPGGETLGQVQQRVWRALEEIVQANLGKTVLLVAHHSVNKCLLLKMLDSPLTKFKVLRQPPCTVSVMEFGQNFRYVQAINLNWRERVSPWHDMEDDLKAKITDCKAAIFDLDGVLLNSMPAYIAAWSGALAEEGVYPPEIEFRKREGEKGPLSIRHFFKSAKLACSEDLIEKVLDRVREKYKSFKGIGLFPNVGTMLERVKASGRKIALVTGSPRYNIETFIKDSILHMFDAVVTSDDVENGKPHPEPYQQAIAKLGVPPEDCLVIENAPFGIASASAAGLFTVAVTSTLPREELSRADLVVDSLERVIGWMGV